MNNSPYDDPKQIELFTSDWEQKLRKGSLSNTYFQFQIKAELNLSELYETEKISLSQE